MAVVHTFELNGSVLIVHESFVSDVDEILNCNERYQVLVPRPWCFACGSGDQRSAQHAFVVRSLDGPRGVQRERQSTPYLDFERMMDALVRVGT